MDQLNLLLVVILQPIYFVFVLADKTYLYLSEPAFVSFIVACQGSCFFQFSFPGNYDGLESFEFLHHDGYSVLVLGYFPPISIQLFNLAPQLKNFFLEQAILAVLKAKLLNLFFVLSGCLTFVPDFCVELIDLPP
jgi:hypothetical protein